MGMVVPDRDTTQSAYGGQLRLYDVHIAKMFEVTHTLCQEIPGLGYLNWVYQAGGGSLFMGRFQVSCKLANDLASAYGLGTPERTRIDVYAEYGQRSTRTYDVPIFNISGSFEVDELCSRVSSYPKTVSCRLGECQSETSRAASKVTSS